MKRTIRLTALTAIAAGALALAPAAASAFTLTLNPTSLTLGSQQVGTTSSPQSTTLTLACGSDVTCLIVGKSFTPSISTTPGFSQTNTCVGGDAVLEVDAVDPSDSCTINASFAPTAPGAIAGTLSTGTDPATMTTGPTASLTGTGLAPPTATAPAAAPAKKRKCKRKKKGASAAKRCKKKKRG